MWSQRHSPASRSHPIAPVRSTRICCLFLLAAVALGACSREDVPSEKAPAASETVPSLAPAEASPATGGRVRGRITLDGTPPPRVTRTTNVDAALCGPGPVVDREMLVDPLTKGVRFAVVTLTNDTAAHAAAAPVVRTVEQAKCEYFPYVTVVPPGSKVVVTNADDGLHDVHVMPDGGTLPDANHSLRPDGRVELAFPKEGHVLLGCDLHYWARAWILVDAAPFAAVTDAEGRYAFAGVPPGSWRLTAWQERLGTVVREVTVENETASVIEDIALPPPPPSRPGAP